MKSENYGWMNLLPAFLTLLFVLVSNALPPDHLRPIVPIILLPCLYFWTLFQPSRLPLWWVFILALITDTLMALPMGMSALICLFLQLLASRYQGLRRKESFAMLWLHYAGVITLSLLLLYLLMSAYHWHFFSALPILAQWGVSLVIYPLIHGLFFALLPRNAGSHGLKS